MKVLLKKLPYYKEFRYIFRAFWVYKKGLAYLYYRRVVGSRIKRVNHPLDYSVPNLPPSLSKCGESGRRPGEVIYPLSKCGEGWGEVEIFTSIRPQIRENPGTNP